MTGPVGPRPGAFDLLAAKARVRREIHYLPRHARIELCAHLMAEEGAFVDNVKVWEPPPPVGPSECA